MSENEDIKSGEEEKENQSNQNIETEQQNQENEENKNVTQSQKGLESENNYDYEKNKKEIMEKIEIRKYQADLVEKYINETGIGTAFQIIFSELLSKKVPVDNYYTYTASRLRQIGREKAAIEKKNEKNKGELKRKRKNLKI